MNVITLCFRNISKDLKHQPDDDCQTEMEQACIGFFLMAAQLRPGVVD